MAQEMFSMESNDSTNAHIQIIDLEQYLGTNPGTSCDMDDNGGLLPMLDDLDTSQPDDIFTDAGGELYSKYLVGSITFDELMREMHRREARTAISPTDHAPRDIDEEMDDDESDQYSDGNASDPDYVPPTQKKTRKRRGSLPPEFSQYLGEAERCLNNDEFEEAEAICLRIISHVPGAPSPYVVLAEICYRKGDIEEATRHLVEAAQRDPTDAQIWTSLINMTEEKNDFAASMHYARLAVKNARNDLALRKRLIKYYERAGKNRDALTLRITSLSISPESTPEEQFKQARSLADKFFKLMDRNNAIRAYEAAFEYYPNDGTDADKNAVLSMMLQLQRYEHALKFFIRYCDVVITVGNHPPLRWDQVGAQLPKSPSCYNVCSYPESMPPELRLKLYLVLVRMKLSTVCLPHLRACCTEEIAEQFSDWLLDIIKSLRTMGLPAAAGELLLNLTQLQATMNMPQIWIMLAEIQVEHGTVDWAIQSYRHVIDVLAPRHTEARIALGKLLRRTGRHREALDLLDPAKVAKNSPKSSGKEKSVRFDKVAVMNKIPGTDLPSHNSNWESEGYVGLSGEEDGDELDDDLDDEEDETKAEAKADAKWLKSSGAVPDALLLSNDPVAYRVAFERCRMLDNVQTQNEFLDEAWNILFSDIARFCGPDWIQLAEFLECTRLRCRLVHRLGTNQSSGTVTEQDKTQARRNVSSLEIWNLLVRLLDILQTRLPSSLKHIESAASWAYFLPAVYNDMTRRVTASNLLITSSLIGQNGGSAFMHLKQLHPTWAHRNQYWNLLNMSVNLSRNYRHCRLIDRMLSKHLDEFPVGIMSANDCVVRGSYRFAIARLTSAREIQPNNSLVLLLLSVAFLGVAMYKHVTSRHPHILQAIGFLSEYRAERGQCQEVYYNIARFYHQFKLGHMAVHYYEKVLNEEPTGDDDEEKSLTDLRPEAAFNLALLYHQNDNTYMAQHLIQKYLVI